MSKLLAVVNAKLGETGAVAIGWWAQRLVQHIKAPAEVAFDELDSGKVKARLVFNLR